MSGWGSCPSVAVLTMVRDEAAWLPRWLGYYAGQVGMENLIVFDDDSTDGSTDDLPCEVRRMPPDWTAGQSFDTARTRLINRTARTLLETYGAVIYTDVDEFLVPDPARHRGLTDYLQARPGVPVMAALGLDVVQHAGVEGPLRADRPVTEQRSFAKVVGGMCKPAIKRVPARWWSAGHGIMAPYTIDPELFLLHLKFADRRHLRAAAARRHERFLAEHSGHVSTWKRPPEQLLTRLRRRIDSVDPAQVPELDPAGLDLSAYLKVQADGRRYRSFGHPWYGLAHQPLVRLPARLRGTV